MKEQNLREGSIFLGLSRLALPIMLTSFIQMAYNLVDMIWIGRIGSGAMAAVGAAGIYLWIFRQPHLGGPDEPAEIRVAHAIGAGEEEKAKSYATAAFQLGLLIVLLYMAGPGDFHKGPHRLFPVWEGGSCRSSVNTC
ncbi:MAG: MATE family efflux transporter [Oscillospiraceae bacterium]